MKLEHIEICDNGIVHYDSGMKTWTKEEVDRINNEYFAKCKEYTDKAVEDGYIEFPIMYENGLGDIQWSACWLPPTFVPSNSEGFYEKYGMKHNIYIPSYKRAGIAYTDKLLQSYNIENYYFCVDPDQYEDYKNEYGMEKVIIRDPTFKLVSKLDLMTSRPIPYNLAGGASFINAILYMSRSLGETHFAIMDDDLFTMRLKSPRADCLTKLTEPNYKYDKDDFNRCSALSLEKGYDFKEMWSDIESIFLKTRNRFAISTEKDGIAFMKPISVMKGSRSYTQYIYSCKALPHAGAQNNDILTSLSNDIAGGVNMIFEGYNYCSVSTQQMAGGCTDSYLKFGTLDKAKCLVTAHPDNCRIVYHYSRIHHNTDFSKTPKRLVGEIKE